MLGGKKMICKKSVIAVFLVLILLFGSACSKTFKPLTDTTSSEISEVSETPQSVKASGFTLLYCKSDSFSPYTAQTKANQQLCFLLFDSLVKIDNDMVVHNSIAKKIEAVSSRSYKVYLKSVSFSDGSSITAEDVLYSIKLAKKSNTRYKNQLAKVKSFYAEDQDTVIINLKENSKDFKNCLDFPILKNGTQSKKTKSSVGIPPIGSGRYVLDIQNKQIILNKKYHGTKPKIKTIQLLCAPDDESAAHYIEMGGISLVYTDLSDGTIPTMNGNLSEVHLNNFVYLGVNYSKYSLMSNENMRYAVASGIDRSAIVKQAFYSYAEEAIGPFRKEWSETKTLQNLEENQNIDVSVANLEKMGYNDKNAGGYYMNSGGDVITLTLLCNKNASRLAAAKLIKEQLKAVGIKIIVNAVDWKTYKSELSKKNFDLYLAETKIEADLDIIPIISNKSNLTYGMSKKGKENSSAKAFKDYLAGKLSIYDFINTFYSEMPVIPVCYRNGVVISSKDLSSVPKSSYSDIFYGIEKISINSK